MSKFGTSVFHKVVQWQESGEVENEYIAYNFSYFAIYIPSLIKIGGNLIKFWQQQLCTFFLKHGVVTSSSYSVTNKSTKLVDLELGSWFIFCFEIYVTIPIKSVKIRPCDNPGMTNYMHILFKNTNRLQKVAKRTENISDIEHYREARRLGWAKGIITGMGEQRNDNWH